MYEGPPGGGGRDAERAAECESSGGVGPERQCGDENENWFRFGKTFFFLCDSPLGAVCLLSAHNVSQQTQSHE